jgi:hypothetical protein
MSPRDPIILAAASAATALHVLDDAILHREPGTTVAGSVTGAGAILAVLAVAAAVFPRLRAGTQALFALLLGALATALGTAATAELVAGDRIWGSHPTGPAALAGGLAALAVGSASIRRAAGSVRVGAVVAALSVAVALPVLAAFR